MIANTKSKGDITEAKCISRLLEKGFSVSIPFGDNQKYDLIVDDGNKLYKVQCKTGRIRKGVLLFNTSTVNMHTRKTHYYTKDEIDWFLVYCPDNDTFYKVEIEKIKNLHIALRIEPTKNNQTKNVNLASEFSF